MLGLGALGGLFLAFVLALRAEALLPWSLAVLGGAYALAVLAKDTAVDGRAPLVGAGLLLCGELAAWSLQERGRIATPPTLTSARAVAVSVLVLAGLVAAAVVVSLSAVPAGRNLSWTVLGAAATVAIVGVAARLARSR